MLISEIIITLQPSLTLTVGKTSIHSVSSVRNLGVMFDSCFAMSSQVQALCCTLNHQLRNTARIRKYLDEDSCKHIVRALVTSCLDYGNSLLLGITKAQLHKLQHIQNRAACLICGDGSSEHVTPYLTRLHWLPVNQRIKFKLIVFVYLPYVSLSHHHHITSLLLYRIVLITLIIYAFGSFLTVLGFMFSKQLDPVVILHSV
ncbi:hypothetical protein HOLleu_13938 [Holothuria leucospilota]|uniref:Uncharacterized protein n=1 Tax=Holothuria leucospilota TaxID=206669 RepID=A0A9Q1C801_HOLLE|nr:hypothetical protein HOLleu_13938 [Holothuria leucospilota]